MTRYVIPADVAWVSREDLDLGAEPHAYIALLPDGPSLSLQGSACMVWLSIHDGGTAHEIALRTSELAEVELDDVLEDVQRLLTDLVGAGVVTVEHAGGVHP
ncbi:PqqD family peptide modification chaperone [Nocardioides sp.]|uniref:PqqD family peptide modification chaperone n=1 Tax=Nocardioides sp. TaxID=35761 RepID=UPI002D01B66F|nr:PqqD family peptide modification chaperone [Nocardioides sp.]HXH77224.1 PqqD family peptide modification chaperone [Nocardioides sp.]